MKVLYVIIGVFLMAVAFGQEQDSITYKKRVLESTEIDILTGFYSQNGNNAAVTGGIGTEKLSDVAPKIVVAIPLNADDVLTIDGTISAYTSASSSNLNPFDKSGASRGYDDDDDDDDNGESGGANSPKGSPWIESSGASKSDVWISGNAAYSHTSDNRNNIYSAHVGFATEFDYKSIGFGAGYTRLFNDQNSEISIKGNVYLDQWHPQYPTELISFEEVDGNLYEGFFFGVDILDQNGNVINKDATTKWNPSNFSSISTKSRNSYSGSLVWSQVLSKRAQFALDVDLVQQSGWLGNPMQRVYFGDKDNYYIGNASDIPNYASPSNKGVFQLADDIERLPDSRFKYPVGARFNYYINQFLVLRSYYRYYGDNWGLTAHTFNVELPIKLGQYFTLYPEYRYYTQQKADYFYPYEEALSTYDYYTSDYDLSTFNANQFGIGISYSDVLTEKHLWKLGWKSLDLRYRYYKRNTGLDFNLISFGAKFILDRKKD